MIHQLQNKEMALQSERDNFHCKVQQLEAAKSTLEAQMRRINADLQKYRSEVIEKDGLLLVQEKAFLEKTNLLST